MAREQARPLDAATAWRAARAGNAGCHVLGWRLDPDEREALLVRWQPLHPIVPIRLDPELWGR